MKKIQFISPPQGVKDHEFEPIPAPVINHESRKGWKNEGWEAYREVYSMSGKEISDLPMPFPEDSLSRKIGLTWKVTLVKSMFTLLSFFTRERGTHQHGGVGATGRITYFENDATKTLPFAKPGQTYPVTIRHSNASFEDDACSDLRAMACRVHGNTEGEMYDFILSTGAILPFWSFSSLLNFAQYRNKCKEDNWDPQFTWLKNSPTAYIAAIESTRLAPESYTKLSYYSVICFEVLNPNKSERQFVKFRILPLDMEEESGLVTSDQQLKIWNQSRLDNNEKPRKYLADEYTDRLKFGSIKYILEAQFRTFDEKKDTHEFFNSARYWDDDVYNWQSVAEIEIDKVMTQKDTNGLKYWLGNTPPGTGIIKAVSADDYNSVGEGRTRVYPLAQKARSR